MPTFIYNKRLKQIIVFTSNRLTIKFKPIRICIEINLIQLRLIPYR